MANGQQIAQKNLDAFRQIIFRGRLNRRETAKAIGCGKTEHPKND
jgi:hypothetical protein